MSATPDRPAQLHAVGVCYRLTPADFAGRLHALAARIGVRVAGVVVSNHPAHAAETLTGGLRALRGTNSQLDFSGYFEGAEELLATHPGAAGANVLFVNDSVFTKHSPEAMLTRVIALDDLLHQLQVPAIGGKFDPYRSICMRNPWSGHNGYISSFCMLLNARALPIIRGLRAEAEADGVMSRAPVGDPAWGAKLQPILREHIRAHLVYRSSPYLWEKSVSDDEELVRKKAQCVYFEHRLSGAIGIDGAVVPINSGPRSRANIFLAEALARVTRGLAGR